MIKIIVLLSSICAIAIGLWKKKERKKEVRRKLAEDARKKLDEAIENDSPSDFLDSWDRVR